MLRNMEARLRRPAYAMEEEEEDVSPISSAVVIITIFHSLYVLADLMVYRTS